MILIYVILMITINLMSISNSKKMYQKTRQSSFPFYFFLLLFELELPCMVSARCLMRFCSVVNSFYIFGKMSGF